MADKKFSMNLNSENLITKAKRHLLNKVNLEKSFHFHCEKICNNIWKYLEEKYNGDNIEYVIHGDEIVAMFNDGLQEENIDNVIEEVMNHYEYIGFSVGVDSRTITGLKHYVFRIQ